LSGIPVPEVREKPSRIILQGDVPSATNPPPGCRFHTRCPFSIDRCHQVEPQLNQISEDHQVACHRYQEIPELAEAKFGSHYL